jgi:Phospholipase_D-nuclease N-terminal
MDIQVQGIFGLLVLIADIWAILNIIQSSSTTGKKLLWILIVLLLPLLGVVIWWLVGPKEARR